ncbi:MAG: thioredoxin domain-containing protein [Thermodesulfobacteriota bacterium]|nr:thioredoxin domain-containing protein [Thermodesulfobacteriota bacterium]
MTADASGANHLAGEQSPYLLQHADNPVEWYPWSSAAIARARRTDRPILLSIGYATCHWCHVMAHESFADPGTAALMNAHFVCIKVDREERPDIDRLYMTAVSAITGSGGWPLNVFLDPQTLAPFFGGTYFPPRPGRSLMITWPDLLQQIADAWDNPDKRPSLLASADRITAFLESTLTGTRRPPAETYSGATELCQKALDAFTAMYDAQNGGFGPAPKFPMPSIINFLLTWAAAGPVVGPGRDAQKEKKALDMAVHTLSAMAKGGIYDQLGGGFHRYATDERWHLPHFEKMLYDNAQLLACLADAYALTENSGLLCRARHTADYIFTEMTHPEGGFYSAQDADSPESASAGKKVEGAFYVWEAREIESLLDAPAAKIFMTHFGVRPEGNVSGPHAAEFPRKNVLYATGPADRTAEALSLSEQKTRELLQSARQTLLAHRKHRPAPDTDDKIITAWNGLMISGLAKLYRVTREVQYRDAAVKAARFIQARLYDPQTRYLARIWRGGEARIAGMAEDYAFLIQGLIDLYEADPVSCWLEWAIALSEMMLASFYDAENGGIFMTGKGHDPFLPLRMKEDTDNVVPSAGSVAARNFYRLAAYTGRNDFSAAAGATVTAIIPLLEKHPSAAPLLLTAAMEQTARDL